MSTLPVAAHTCPAAAPHHHMLWRYGMWARSAVQQIGWLTPSVVCVRVSVHPRFLYRRTTCCDCAGGAQCLRSGEPAVPCPQSVCPAQAPAVFHTDAQTLPVANGNPDYGNVALIAVTFHIRSQDVQLCHGVSLQSLSYTPTLSFHPYPVLIFLKMCALIDIPNIFYALIPQSCF